MVPLVAFKKNLITGQEFATNEYIDGKQVFRKRVNFGNLPNSNTKNVAHGISNADFLKVEGFANDKGTYFHTLPYTGTGSFGSTIISVVITNNVIMIATNADCSAVTAFVDIYYTKK